MLEDTLVRANAILASHTLAAIRLVAWDVATEAATFEVFHLEWPSLRFGELRFHGVSYLQCPTQTTWGYRLRLSPDADLPSRGDRDPNELVFELYTPDAAEPSAYLIAATLDARPA
jgi:hypothetical protein